MKYKGFTLLECMAYLAIYVLILFVDFNLLLNIEKGYYKYANEHRINHEVNQVNLTIDRLINEDVTSVISSTATGEILIFYYNDNSMGGNRNELFVLKNKLVIAYYREAKLETINEILTNVDWINLIEKDKVKYLIINKEGQRYIKCLETKRIKEIS